MDEADREIALSSMLFSGLHDEARDALLDGARSQVFERGATIFMQGETARALYIVADGWVKLYRIAPNGTEAVVGVFTRGRSFGEPVAIRGDRYPVTAEAVTWCRLIRIDGGNFLRTFRENPEIAVAVLSSTFTHLHSLVAQLESLKARSGSQRVAEFLLELCDCRAGSCTVTMPYDKVLIAGRLGMKPESLSRAFSRLRELGVDVQRNTAEIDDIEALRRYVEEDPAGAWER